MKYILIRKGKSFKMVGCILMLLMLLTVSYKTIDAAVYRLNVTKYTQEKSQWCWAACAKMMGAYHGYNYSQNTICKKAWGKVVDESLTLTATTRVLKFTTKKNVKRSGVLSYKSFVTDMKGKRPRVLRMSWISGKGHLYVVAGTKDASGPVQNALYLIDPEPGKASGYFSYSALKNGTTLASGTGKYTNTWSTL